MIREAGRWSRMAVYDWEPVQVTGLTGGISSAATGGSHLAVVRMDGTVWTWGWNSEGQ